MQRFTVANLKTKETNHLPNKVELAIGMKVMVLQNIAPCADLANRSRGIISDIILDPRESIDDLGATTITVKHPPVAVIFETSPTTDKTVHGLRPGTLPILPSHTTFTLKGEHKCTIDRKQFPLTPVYAFTDYKSQGQTMKCVIVDIGKPPSGSLTPFNAYIALSRSRGRDTIRLLRDFDDKLFTTHPSEELRQEDLRLTDLEEKTEKRYKTGEFGWFNDE